MHGTLKIKNLAMPIVLFQMVFACPAVAHDTYFRISSSDANAGDRFGVSVTIDGNTAVVGAYMADSNGAAYVFENSGSSWIQSQKLTASDGLSCDKFGRSVAIQADTIVVGAPLGDSNYPNTGAAYVFKRSGPAWIQQQKLTAYDANKGDKFGEAVSISNDTIVVGAYGDNSYKGSAYVFIRPGLNWNFQQKLADSDANNFGFSVAIDANTIIIGASNSDNSEFQDVGSAYVFTRTGQSWFQQAVLWPSDTDQGYHFGGAVALDGNLAVVGAYENDIDGVPDAGAAYVFAKTDTGWVERQKLFDVNNPCVGDDFGISVAVENNTIFIGCLNKFVNGKETGAVCEFVRDGQTWVQHDLLSPADADVNDSFGSSIAMSGHFLVAGASLSDANGESSGSAYIFTDALAADLDSDSNVDFADFAVFARAWRTSSGQPAYNPACDISIPHNMLIDLFDLNVLCDDWLAGK